MLFSLGMSSNVPNNNGNTATHSAARNGHFEIMKLLTSYTSKANVANYLGITPAALARSKGYQEILHNETWWKET